jgi:HAD superfamily hydrolase (TIGR01509 family)
MTSGSHGLDAILFDFMGVLLFGRKEYSAEKIVNAVDDMIGGVVDDAAFRGSVLTGLKIDPMEFERILALVPEKYESLPPLWNLLPALRRKYKLGIINNGTRLTFPYFDAKFKLSERFDAILSSGAEGVRKPDPQIYLRAAARLGVEPGRCLFMDDSETNVRGAQQVAMQTVHWPDRYVGFQRFIEKITADGFRASSPADINP